MPRFPILLLAAAPLFGTSAQAQNQQSDQLAAIFIESNWEQAESMLSAMVPALGSQMREAGFSEKITKTFLSEVTKGLTREVMQKWMSAAIGDTLNEDETKEVVKFFQSTLGKKYLGLSRSVAGDTRFINPVIKLACERTLATAGADEAGKLGSACKTL
jgi:hypothetical protein